MIKTNKIIYFLYIICLTFLFLQLKTLTITHFDIFYQSKDIIYFYFFFTHFIIFLLKYGYYQNLLSHYFIYQIIRYKKNITIYHILISECLIQSLIITFIKIIIEYCIFHYTQNNISYFLFILLITMTHMSLEIFISKDISLIVIGIYLALSLTLGDIFYEFHLQPLIYLFISNLIMTSRFTHPLIIFIFIVIVYIVGLLIIKKKEFI